MNALVSLAVLWCAALGCGSKPTATPQKPRLVPTEDRSLARNDMAKGDLVVKGKSVPLRHAYASLETDPFEPSRPPHVRIVLTDVPVDSLEASYLRERMEGRGLHYVEVQVDLQGDMFSSEICHAELGESCVSKVTIIGEPNIRFEPKDFAGHRVAGRLYTARPDTSDGVSYSFSADFQATLWEITGRHLGSRPDGSFGVERGRALGSFTVDGQSFTFAHAYARATPEGTEVLLTEKPRTKAELEEYGSLVDALVNSEWQGLRFVVDANGVGAWQWRHARLEMGCGLCRELRYAAVKMSGAAIAGTVYSRTPRKWKDQSYEFKATFHAPVSSTRQ